MPIPKLISTSTLAGTTFTILLVSVFVGATGSIFGSKAAMMFVFILVLGYAMTHPTFADQMKKIAGV